MDALIDCLVNDIGLEVHHRTDAGSHSWRQMRHVVDSVLVQTDTGHQRHLGFVCRDDSHSEIPT